MSAPTPAIDLGAARRGLGVLALASAGAGGLNYLFIAVMGVLLPAEEFVTVAAAQGMLLVVGSAAASTVPWLTAQQLARAGDSAGARAAAARTSAVSAAVLAAAAALGTTALSGFASPAERAALAVAAAMICCGQVGVGWAQGSGRYRLLASLVVGEVVLKVGVGVVVVLSGGGALGVIASAAGGAALLVIAGAVLVGPALRRGAGLLRLDPGWWRTPLAVGGLRGAVAALLVVDVVLVALLLPASRAVADYQLAMSLGRAPVFLATAVGQAYLAVLAAHPRERRVREETWQRLLGLALPAAAVLATAPVLWLDRVIPQGAGVAQYLPFAAATGLAMALVQLVTTWGQVGERLARVALTVAALCLLQGGLVVLGGSLGGVLGVALATSAGAAVAVGALVLVTSAGMRLRLLPRLLPVLAMAALVSLRPFPLAWLGAVTALGVAVLMTLLRPAAAEGAA